MKMTELYDLTIVSGGPVLQDCTLTRLVFRRTKFGFLKWKKTASAKRFRLKPGGTSMRASRGWFACWLDHEKANCGSKRTPLKQLSTDEGKGSKKHYEVKS